MWLNDLEQNISVSVWFVMWRWQPRPVKLSRIRRSGWIKAGCSCYKKPQEASPVWDDSPCLVSLLEFAASGANVERRELSRRASLSFITSQWMSAGRVSTSTEADLSGCSCWTDIDGLLWQEVNPHLILCHRLDLPSKYGSCPRLSSCHCPFTIHPCIVLSSCYHVSPTPSDWGVLDHL